MELLRHTILDVINLMESPWNGIMESRIIMELRGHKIGLEKIRKNLVCRRISKKGMLQNCLYLENGTTIRFSRIRLCLEHGIHFGVGPCRDDYLEANLLYQK